MPELKPIWHQHEADPVGVADSPSEIVRGSDWRLRLTEARPLFLTGPQSGGASDLKEKTDKQHGYEVRFGQRGHVDCDLATYVLTLDINK